MLGFRGPRKLPWKDHSQGFRRLLCSLRRSLFKANVFLGDPKNLMLHKLLVHPLIPQNLPLHILLWKKIYIYTHFFFNSKRWA